MVSSCSSSCKTHLSAKSLVALPTGAASYDEHHGGVTHSPFQAIAIRRNKNCSTRDNVPWPFSCMLLFVCVFRDDDQQLVATTGPKTKVDTGVHTEIAVLFGQPRGREAQQDAKHRY